MGRLTIAGASGGWAFGGREDAIEDMTIDLPGEVRNVDYR